MEYKLDMSMMLAMHDALRRELVQVARVARLRDDDPGKLLHAALGWELFKKFLTVHHRSEDDALWPPLRAAVATYPDRVAVVDAMEAEHAAIDPLLVAIDAAAADADYGYQRFGDVIDELVTKLTGHLTHEETDGLPLIDTSLTLQQWLHYAQVHTQRIGGDQPVAMPWLLDGAGPQVREHVLGLLPPPVQTAFREQWQPKYATLNLWNTAGKPTPPDGAHTDPGS